MGEREIEGSKSLKKEGKTEEIHVASVWEEMGEVCVCVRRKVRLSHLSEHSGVRNKQAERETDRM